MLTYLERHLNTFAMSSLDKQITSSMINNYVKQKIIPAPVKKKYSKMHLAYLIIICILKQSLSISSISKMIPSDLNEQEIMLVYTSFVKNHTKAFGYVTEQISAVAQPILSLADSNEDRMNDLVLQVLNMFL